METDNLEIETPKPPDESRVKANKSIVIKIILVLIAVLFVAGITWGAVKLWYTGTIKIGSYYINAWQPSINNQPYFNFGKSDRTTAMVEFVTQLYPEYQLVKNESKSTTVDTQVNTQETKYQKISDFAGDLGWDENNNLYYFKDGESKLYKWDGDKSVPIINIDNDVYELQYTTDGKYVVVFAATGEDAPMEKYIIDMQTKAKLDFPFSSSFSSIGSDGKTIWGRKQDSDLVCGYQVGGNVNCYSLEQPENFLDGDDFSVVDNSSSERWLVVNRNGDLKMWLLSSGKGVFIKTYKDVYNYAWVGDSNLNLIYLSNNSLYLSQRNTSWKNLEILPNVKSPINSIPGSSEVVYSSYYPSVGGIAFWAIDSVTKNIRLLSEPIVESGSIDQFKKFTISPDGKKLAFLNTKNTLYIVYLNEQ